MKKILIVINTMGHGGAEVSLIELLNRLDPKKYSVSIYVLTGQGELINRLPSHVTLLNESYCEKSVFSKDGRAVLRKTVIKALLKKGSIFREIPYILRNLFVMFRQGQVNADKLLWKAIAGSADRFDTEYDLAIAYLEGGATYYVAKHVKAKRKVAFVHVDYKEAGYLKSLDKNCYTYIDRILVVSEEVKNTFLRVYPECENKTHIFHNILDIEGIKKKSLTPGGFEDDFDGIRILSVGCLTRQKAFEMSIDACRLLKDSGEKIRWYVLGEGNERKFLENRISKLGLENDFIMYGHMDNPYPYMRQTDIYVHASRFEGKSIAVQEAQILERPIIVSDCSGNREQVIQGIDGIICDFEPDGIAEAVKYLIHNPDKREKIGMAAALKNKEEADQMNILFELLED